MKVATFATLMVVAFTLIACTRTPASPRAAGTTTFVTTNSATTATIATTTTSRSTTTTPTTTTSTTTRPPATATAVAFSATITTVTATDLPSTYRTGCPVGPDALRMLHVSYWGFDDRPHVGAIVVNAAVTRPVVDVFAMLFHEHFPIRRMEPVDAFGGSDPASMAADNTSGFNCRDAVATGPPHWSAHAYGEAIDVNPVENPYIEGGRVQPPAGASFVDRGRLRPGMAAPGTSVNRAFASVGWLWGGRWTAPDYQHFSKTGG